MLMDAGARAQVAIPGADPFVVIPQSHRLESILHLVPPTRIRTQVSLSDPASFTAYVNRFKDEDTLIFADVTDTGAKFTAILDFHKAGARPGSEDAEQPAKLDTAIPRYLSHAATFECQKTTEWLRWMDCNGKKMSQVEFATWLEENQDLIVEPSGGELLELVQNLEGKSDVRFATAVKLQNGRNSLQYDEDVTLSGTVQSKSGKMEIPQNIGAGIAPFQGVSKYAVNARLKYRIEQRKLTFWFETITPHRIVRDAVNDVLLRIESETKLTPLAGKVSG